MHRAVLVTVALLALVACTSMDEPVGRAEAPLDDRVAAPAEPVGAPATGRVAQLSPAARETVTQLALPILLPEEPRLLESMVVTEGPHFVAWGADGDGVHVALHGTNRRWEVGGVDAPAHQDHVRGQPGFVTQNEGIRIASWDERGMTWALDVECDRVLDDPRCADEDYVRALAEALETVTPEPEASR